MRLVYFGMAGAFSYPPLRALFQAVKTGRKSDLTVAAVILPASAVPGFNFDGPIALLPPERPQSDLPLLQPYVSETIVHLAWANDAPVYLVRNLRETAVHALINDIAADIACVACFPYRIPENILSLPQHGFLNIHPSLLPAYRGPEPLFWIFRNGDQERTGVTLHWMDAGLDTGDILSRRPVTLADGTSGAEADSLCATVGGEMLLKGLEQIESGSAPRQPQPPGGSYYPSPTAEAFKLERNWPARRAFNFMRGTAEWNHPYSLQIGSRTLVLRTAVNFEENRVLDEPVVEEDGRYLIQFSPGVLAA